MAPPLGFTLENGIPNFSMVYTDWEANASFNSKISISEIETPAFSKTFIYKEKNRKQRMFKL